MTFRTVLSYEKQSRAILLCFANHVAADDVFAPHRSFSSSETTHNGWAFRQARPLSMCDERFPSSFSSLSSFRNLLYRGESDTCLWLAGPGVPPMDNVPLRLIKGNCAYSLSLRIGRAS